MSSSFKRRGKKPSRPGGGAASPPPSVPGPAVPVSPGVGVISDDDTATAPRSDYAAPGSSLPGTRPWTGGQTLTSSGSREFDSLILSAGGGANAGGGGQPLRTCVLVEEDRLSDDLARCLCRTWCAEGAAQGQDVMLGCWRGDPRDALGALDEGEGGGAAQMTHHTMEGSTPQELEGFVSSLPRNLHLDKQREKAKKLAEGDGARQERRGREAIAAIVEEEEGEGDEEDGPPGGGADEGLVNAWQYRRDVQEARSGMRSSGLRGGGAPRGGGLADGVYCHSYDLSGRMADQFTGEEGKGANPLVDHVRIVSCAAELESCRDHSAQGTAFALFRSLWRHVLSRLDARPGGTVVRLFLRRLPVDVGAALLPLLMAKIRKSELPVVVLATVRPWRFLSSYGCGDGSNGLDALSALRSAADVAVSADSLSSLRVPPPPEFSLLQGILTVRRCAPSTSAGHYTDSVVGRRPLAERFGMRRDGRKLAVQLLHLPPEEYSRGGSSTAGVRSGGGKAGAAAGGGCSSLAGGTALDF